MLTKIIFTLALITCVSVLPSYTNTCAKPHAAFLNNKESVNSCEPETAIKPVRKIGHGLEVFPLELISIQL
jgi:hypothetical protein